jgi:hypothetical protein
MGRQVAGRERKEANVTTARSTSLRKLAGTYPEDTTLRAYTEHRRIGARLRH